MALPETAMSEVMGAFKTGDGVDLIRDAVRLVLQQLIEIEAAPIRLDGQQAGPVPVAVGAAGVDPLGEAGAGSRPSEAGSCAAPGRSAEPSIGRLSRVLLAHSKRRARSPFPLHPLERLAFKWDGPARGK